MKLHIWLFFLLQFACIFSVCAKKSTPVIFELERGNVRLIIIQTVHFSLSDERMVTKDREHTIQYRRYIRDLLNEMDAVYFERDGSKVGYFDRSYLRDSELSSDLKNRILNAASRSANLNLQAVLQYDDWVIASVLNSARSQRIQNNSILFGTEYEIERIADEYGIPIIPLEESNYLYESYSNISKSEQRHMLENALISDASYENKLRMLIVAYKSGEYVSACDMLINDKKMYPTYWKYVVERRNLYWANKISSLKKGNYMVAVGLAHTCGENALHKKLEKYGFKLKFNSSK